MGFFYLLFLFVWSVDTAKWAPWNIYISCLVLLLSSSSLFKITWYFKILWCFLTCIILLIFLWQYSFMEFKFSSFSFKAFCSLHFLQLEPSLIIWSLIFVNFFCSCNLVSFHKLQSEFVCWLLQLQLSLFIQHYRKIAVWLRLQFSRLHAYCSCNFCSHTVIFSVASGCNYVFFNLSWVLPRFMVWARSTVFLVMGGPF